MKKLLKALTVFFAPLFVLWGTTSKAQQFQFNPTGVSGSVGAGVALFNVLRPSANFKIDQGIFADVSGEKGFGFANLFLTFSLDYLTTTGETNYNYTDLGGTNYTGSDVAYRMSVFEGGLGLRFKLLKNYWLRPYVEAGGLAGYFKLDYSDLSSKVAGSGTDYKASDALLGFGWYYEGGAEISFSKNFGFRVAARFTDNTTKNFETLANQAVHYKSEVYYLSALTSF